jgi:hypothetical protein
MEVVDMAFFDDLKDRAVDLGRAGVAKSKQLAEITKLSLNNASEEDTIKKAYVEIGKLYYAERGSAPEAAYVALCERITTAKLNIEENKARIAQLKQESVVVNDAPSSVESDVPPEEPQTCGCAAQPEEPSCGCCCTPEEEGQGGCCCGSEEEEQQQG